MANRAEPVFVCCPLVVVAYLCSCCRPLANIWLRVARRLPVHRVLARCRPLFHRWLTSSTVGDMRKAEDTEARYRLSVRHNADVYRATKTGSHDIVCVVITALLTFRTKAWDLLSQRLYILQLVFFCLIVFMSLQSSKWHQPGCRLMRRILLLFNSFLQH